MTPRPLIQSLLPAPPVVMEPLESQLPVRKQCRLRLPGQCCTPLGSAALGTVIAGTAALMECSTQAWTVTPNSRSDLKYLSQRLNMLQQVCTQAVGGSPQGMLGAFTIVGSFRSKMAIQSATYGV